ncbi:hydrogenase expression/formation protein HypD [Desulfonauticus submarinus]|uniref:Hydrogenase expression/formation protein HypD n=1 Tax=Desulfonauticus submarinus TaxID=206665 RepID=A0A1G9ZKC7_9BACT|nr:hydrogenase formation protein HypD [Desulfonauticus submarinus]SDN21557.1 hydrogenase expression/formation protein HypD [Desulfonauticus submarinus]
MNLLNQFKNPRLCEEVLTQLKNELKGPFRFMEVCGTHTVAIFQSGLRSLFPEELIHVSGPGCPVCVTHEREVAAFLELAQKDVILATFGDLMRVPGPDKKTLKDLQAEGARIKIVYSPFDALKLAIENPKEKVVFLGIGFETTAPTVAATLNLAKEQGITNFSVLCLHKLVPPALEALVSDKSLKVEGFLLPGHVSAIIGLEPYKFLAKNYGIPSVIGGFEPLDILQAIYLMVKMANEEKPEAINNYKRVVKDQGNLNALAMMDKVFEPCGALWRGIGEIPNSGLKIREEFAQFDARKLFSIEELPDVPPIKGCRCGDVLKGIIRPDECPLFKKVCTPQSPVGPCMVSTEGSCAAYYKYSL